MLGGNLITAKALGITVPTPLRDSEAEGIGSLEVYDQLDFSGLLPRPNQGAEVELLRNLADDR